MANNKEARARIKINKLLEEAGWRFFDDKSGSANIQLEPNVKIVEKDFDAFGNDFEKSKNGYIDFLLLDGRGFHPKHRLRLLGLPTSLGRETAGLYLD